ncbi:MAG: dihydrodipicolinate synthase family protein [Chitinivibrionales bacterium]|nr:dihydrodipicolinate synthase family protein [Chitinivibrionales bacterium]
MITPLKDDTSLDFAGLHELVEWYLAAGVTGLFAVCQSSEMFHLSVQERIDLARAVVDFADGRVPVVASGLYGDAPDELADLACALRETDVHSVVALVNQFAAPDETDDVLRDNFMKFVEMTGDIHLGLYECPQPSHRIMPPQVLGELARTGRFTYFKSTSKDVQIITDQLHAARGTPLQLFNAHAASLLAGLQMGAHGCSALAANLFPELLGWLCTQFNNHPETAEKVQRFVTIVDYLVRYNYPANAKLYLRMRGKNIGTTSRIDDFSFEQEDIAALDALYLEVAELCKIVGVATIL